MKRVAVILSYYNGYRYIEEQVKSIVNQTYPSVDIFIRDDGSTCSRSKEALVSIKDNYPNVTIFECENVGVVKSFLELLSYVEGYDYYAFCDQDDYWLPQKIEVAVSKLSDELVGDRKLYCGSYSLVDKCLNEIKRNKSRHVVPSFQNAIFKNFCTGCTCVIDSELRQVALSSRYKGELPMHDWWLLLTAYCVGNVIYDNDSYIYYRQHDSNVVGGLDSSMFKLIRYFKYMLNKDDTRSKLIENLLLNYNCLGGENMQYLNRLSHASKNVFIRLKLLVNYPFSYANILDRISASILLILRRF